MPARHPLASVRISFGDSRAPMLGCPPYDFWETETQLTLVFYTRSGTEPAQFVLAAPTQCTYGDHVITFYRPTHTPVLRRTAHALEVTLTKQTPGRWYSVSGPRSTALPTLPPADAPAEAPPHAQTLMDTLRGIYASADSDTRRAMNKSFEQSNGTVLSTNWKDIAPKDIKPE